VLLGAYVNRVGIIGMKSYNFEALSARDQIEAALEQGSKIHPQYRAEFMNGIAVAWHRVPWTLGCSGLWNDDLRAKKRSQTAVSHSVPYHWPDRLRQPRPTARRRKRGQRSPRVHPISPQAGGSAERLREVHA